MIEAINREELMHLIEYQNLDGDKRRNYSTIEDFILDEIKTIKEFFKNKTPLENNNFILSLRADHCLNEFF